MRLNKEISWSSEVHIDWNRIGFFTFSVTSGLAAGWYGQPLIHGNNEAIGVIVNVFSILAGFLVTIMTLLGEPSLFRGKTWRSDAVKKSNVYRRLARHKWLFIIYLSVLGFVFVATLLTKHCPECLAVVWMERAYLAMATVAFIMSLALPHRLMNLQLARFDEMVECRRKGGDTTGNGGAN